MPAASASTVELKPAIARTAAEVAKYLEKLRVAVPEESELGFVGAMVVVGSGTTTTVAAEMVVTGVTEPRPRDTVSIAIDVDGDASFVATLGSTEWPRLAGATAGTVDALRMVETIGNAARVGSDAATAATGEEPATPSIAGRGTSATDVDAGLRSCPAGDHSVRADGSPLSSVNSAWVVATATAPVPTAAAKTSARNAWTADFERPCGPGAELGDAPTSLTRVSYGEMIIVGSMPGPCVSAHCPLVLRPARLAAELAADEGINVPSACR